MLNVKGLLSLLRMQIFGNWIGVILQKRLRLVASIWMDQLILLREGWWLEFLMQSLDRLVKIRSAAIWRRHNFPFNTTQWTSTESTSLIAILALQERHRRVYREWKASATVVLGISCKLQDHCSSVGIYVVMILAEVVILSHGPVFALVLWDSNRRLWFMLYLCVRRRILFPAIHFLVMFHNMARFQASNYSINAQQLMYCGFHSWYKFGHG